MRRGYSGLGLGAGQQAERVGLGRQQAALGVLLELRARVLDVEVAHRQLADAVERAERRVLAALHAQALGLVGQVRAARVEDRVVVAAAQLAARPRR